VTRRNVERILSDIVVAPPDDVADDAAASSSPASSSARYDGPGFRLVRCLPRLRCVLYTGPHTTPFAW
jgi:hypothetical protein